MKIVSRLYVLMSFFLITVLFYSLWISNTTYTNVMSKSIEQVIEISVYNDNGEIISEGTGFFINQNGYILTNKHIVETLEQIDYLPIIKGRTVIEEEYNDLVIIDISEEHDLAILRVSENSKDYKAVKFATSANIDYGDSIYTIGNTYGYGLTLLIGNVSAPTRLVEYNNIEINAIQMNIDIESGNSGGPVYNNFGRVIGISTFRILDIDGNRMPGMNFALPLDVINKYIDSVDMTD